MVGTLVLTIIGLIVIIVHAGGTWLTTTVRELLYIAGNFQNSGVDSIGQNNFVSD